MLFQAGDYVIADAGRIDQAQENRGEAEVPQVLRDVSADPAVDIADAPGVSPGRDIVARRIAFDIDKNTSQYNDTHERSSFSGESRCSMVVTSGVMPSFS